MSEGFSQDQVREIAVASAREAIAAMKKAQKRGRSDTGSGSKVIGSLIRDHREEEGWSVTDLAEKSGLHPTTIGKLEAGNRGLGFKTFCKLAALMDPAFADRVILYVADRP